MGGFGDVQQRGQVYASLDEFHHGRGCTPRRAFLGVGGLLAGRGTHLGADLRRVGLRLEDRNAVPKASRGRRVCGRVFCNDAGLGTDSPTPLPAVTPDGVCGREVVLCPLSLRPLRPKVESLGKQRLRPGQREEGSRGGAVSCIRALAGAGSPSRGGGRAAPPSGRERRALSSPLNMAVAGFAAAGLAAPGPAAALAAAAGE